MYLKITDTSGAYAKSPFYILVDDAPQVSSSGLPNKVATVGTMFNYNIPSSTFTDANNDTLTLKGTKVDGSSLPNWIFFNTYGQSIGALATSDSNDTTIKVCAYDKYDLSACTTMTLRVMPESSGMSEGVKAGLIAGGTCVGVLSPVGIVLAYKAVKGANAARKAVT